MSDSQYYFVKDVAAIMEISERKAYDVIRDLNGELKKMGKIIIRGRILKTYFHHRTDVDIADITSKGKLMRIAT